MTHNDFLKKLKQYFGQYRNKTVEQVTAAYIAENIPESDLEKILRLTLSKFEGRMYPPEVVDFYKLVVEPRIASDAEAAWVLLLEQDSAPDTLITDPLIYNAVIFYGNWAKFCDERDNNRKWAHKEFIASYKRHAEYGAILREPEVLVGWYRENYGQSFRVAGGIQIIGDKTKAKTLLAKNKATSTNKITSIEKLAESSIRRVV